MFQIVGKQVLRDVLRHVILKEGQCFYPSRKLLFQYIKRDMFLHKVLKYMNCMLQTIRFGEYKNSKVPFFQLQFRCMQALFYTLNLRHHGFVYQGADVNVKARHLETPIFEAIRGCHDKHYRTINCQNYVKIIENLKNKGADVNVTNKRDYSPLALASNFGQFDIAR